MEGLVNRDFWRGRRVLVTGHTGFKGAWACRLLSALGAEITGISLDPPPGPSAFDALNVAPVLHADHRLDIRDAAPFAAAIRAARPQVVLHLAAQALVGAGYRDPDGTFRTNLDGTVHLLQALRGLEGVIAAVIVTSDKVYRNDGHGRAFVESDALGGADPYSASKAAAELAVACWRKSFGAELPPLATARAGNVIGGGDFGADRLVPDLVRATVAGQPLMVRRPDATRPFQHVLDVLRGYLLLAQHIATTPLDAVNFGPADRELRVRDLLEIWGMTWRQVDGPVYDEARRLALDSSLAATALGWRPRHTTPQAIAATAAWYLAWQAGTDTGAEAAIAEALA